MKIKYNYWLTLSIFNLTLVAFIGVILRIKIAFEFPYFDQKHLHHGHSHFAFNGWISQTIFILMIMFLQKHADEKTIRKYKLILISNIICSYGMLISFIIQGYGAVSISFSTLSIITSYIFIVFYLRDLKKIPKDNPAKSWFIAAFLFNVLSSFGTYSLALMMSTHNIHINTYLASVYFFLHFQYNGWFFFALMGLLMGKMKELIPDFKYNRMGFLLFTSSCIPAFLLSDIWMNLPLWLLVIVVLSAVMQIAGWIKILQLIRANITILKSKIGKMGEYLFLMAGIALTLKLFLQLGSVVPVLNNFTTGFRPIVIAYLHLVLLGVITVFLLGYLFSFGLIKVNKLSKTGVIIFVCGIILNEVVLMIQGIGDFSYTSIPHANEMLFAISILMFLGLLSLLISQRKVSE